MPLCASVWVKMLSNTLPDPITTTLCDELHARDAMGRGKYGTSVTDAGIASLKGLVNLDSLNAHSTQVSDAALATLQSLRKLKQVHFWKSRVSADGAKTLQKSLPGSSVSID
jgi:hypothetical protein